MTIKELMVELDWCRNSLNMTEDEIMNMEITVNMNPVPSYYNYGFRMRNMNPVFDIGV